MNLRAGASWVAPGPEPVKAALRAAFGGACRPGLDRTRSRSCKALRSAGRGLPTHSTTTDDWRLRCERL